VCPYAGSINNAANNLVTRLETGTELEGWLMNVQLLWTRTVNTKCTLLFILCSNMLMPIIINNNNNNIYWPQLGRHPVAVVI
jgi:hypothetical protein